ncbi:MAG: TPM domain-containing protein [Lachnospiraceae bacterium]|nr:TPM domain-containing protein [Lachnospiraceae bacterium]
MFKKKIFTLVLTLAIGLTIADLSGIAVYAEESTADTAAKPDWYPADPKNFTFFHDENAPRVVDDADIFTDAEEIAMEERITELRNELKKDIVVFTDKSSYGLDRSVYCADFYDFNGYGYGSEREGYCLFICMEEGNRGFWTCSTGTESRSIHTERVANALDDVLYEYMKDAKYGEGALDWIENIGTLYHKGSPFAPDWYPERGTELKLHHDPNVLRVFQDYDILSDEELDELSDRVYAISSKYDTDILIYIAYCPAGLSRDEYIDTFYKYWGYGFGNDYRGVVLAIFPLEDYSQFDVYTYGASDEIFGNTGYTRLCDHLSDEFNDAHDYEGAVRFLKDLEHALKTGRVARTMGSWGGSLIWALVVGAFIGWIFVSSAASKMKPVHPEENANMYMLKDSVRIDRIADNYVGTTTSKKYDPIQRSSSSSSGGSSYRSSYSGSSGSSHTGSGRSF